MDNNHQSETLAQFKKENGLFYDSNILKINSYIEHEYIKYTNNPNDYSVAGCKLNFADILKHCKDMKPQLIPYSSLTQTIFKYDLPLSSRDNKEINETDFASIIEGAFESYLTTSPKFNNTYITDANGNNILPFNNEAENIDVEKLNVQKDEIIVFYKIIEHLKLAIHQKRGLYEEQKEEINELTQKITETKETYDSMISNYISILGILAAILMTAFGGIQAFTAIYNKDNGFSVVDSIIIACIGFLGIILMIFMLLNGVSKLAGRSISSINYRGKWYQRYPTLLYSFIILSSIVFFLLTYKFIIAKPQFDYWWLWYLVPITFLLLTTGCFIFQEKRESRKH